MVITEIDALATSLEEGILSVDVGFHSWSPRMLMGNASFIFQSPQFMARNLDFAPPRDSRPGSLTHRNDANSAAASRDRQEEDQPLQTSSE